MKADVGERRRSAMVAFDPMLVRVRSSEGGSRALAALAVAVAGCSSPSGPGASPCTTDANGVQGGTDVVYLTVSDAAFAVGGVDSGSTQPNITVENLASVTLTLANVGSRPHDFVVRCQPTPNAQGCPMQSCFPPQANVPPLAPGATATTTFTAPFKEGPYTFVSDVGGDARASADGGATGLVGELLVM